MNDRRKLIIEGNLTLVDQKPNDIQCYIGPDNHNLANLIAAYFANGQSLSGPVKLGRVRITVDQLGV